MRSLSPTFKREKQFCNGTIEKCRINDKEKKV